MLPCREQGSSGEPSLSPRGAVGLRFCSPRRLKTKNRFALLHQIEAIARNRFQISRVCFEHIDLASLPREQNLLFVYLFLQVIDLGPALDKSFVRWNEQTHNHEPDSEDEQDAKNSIKSLPNCGFATGTEVAVGLIHFSASYCRTWLCHQVLARFAEADCTSRRDQSGKESQF